MAAVMVSRSKLDGWKGSWFVHRGQETTMLENQDLEPRTTELMVPAEGDGSQHRHQPTAVN